MTYKMMFCLRQFGISWCCGSNLQFFVELTRVTGDNFCVKMFCQINCQAGFPDSCSSDNGDEPFQKSNFCKFTKYDNALQCIAKAENINKKTDAARRKNSAANWQLKNIFSKK